jgi:uncharacterized membrane protein YiaA
MPAPRNGLSQPSLSTRNAVFEPYIPKFFLDRVRSALPWRVRQRFNIFIDKENKMVGKSSHQPSSAFVYASWGALIIGFCAYLAGLYNAGMQLNEKGYYFTVLAYGLYAAVSLQKSVRDRVEGIPVTMMYFSLSWLSILLAIALLVIGLFNATLTLSEKGFYAMSFALALFGAIAVQKNTRDVQAVARPRIEESDAI